MRKEKIFSEGGTIQDKMDEITIEINGRTYDIKLACTDEEREVGLQGVKDLPYDEGMLFCFDEPTLAAFWMKDTLIPLDLVFIDEYGEVKAVFRGEPMNEEMLEVNDIKYVLEVNIDSGITPGDDIDLSDLEDYEDEEELDGDSDDEGKASSTMSVLDANGDSQMELQGGERIFSRPNTKTLVRLSKRAYKSKDDKDYKALGKKLFAYLETQNTKEDDYVEIPD